MSSNDVKANTDSPSIVRSLDSLFSPTWDIRDQQTTPQSTNMDLITYIRTR